MSVRILQRQNRQFNSKRGTLARAETLSPDCAGVHFHEIANDGKPETKSAVLTSDGPIGLRKALKEVRQEFGRYSLAGIADADLHMRRQAATSYKDFSATGCELNAIRQQVPKH